MMKSYSVVAALIPLLAGVAVAGGPAAEKPRHVILFVIDGLSYKVWDKLSIPTLRSLAKEGTVVEKDYLPPPAHPHTGAYAELHSCSIPNPIMMAGTVFITRQSTYLHQSFPDSTTAFVVNSTAYPTLAAGYGHVYQEPGPDAESVRAALDMMRSFKPRFMRVHLQNTGSAGSECLSTEKDVAWRNNIWAGDSPYRQAAERADSLLGVLIEGLRKLNVLDQCALLVVGDHGQDDGGWHPLQLPDGAITTMVLWGKGIRKGGRVSYAEHIDIVPTLCALAQVEAPKTSQGQVISGALESPPGLKAMRKTTVKELNEQLRSFNKLNVGVGYSIEQLPETKQGRYYSRLDGVKQEFYDIGRFTEWPKFKNLDELYAGNRDALTKLQNLRADLDRIQK
jgi:hypothetical protein